MRPALSDVRVIDITARIPETGGFTPETIRIAAGETVRLRFRRARSMLGGTSELYYAKVRRGGMGTGMPSWGPVFTSDETWALVDHRWTFVFRGGPFRADADHRP